MRDIGTPDRVGSWRKSSLSTHSDACVEVASLSLDIFLAAHFLASRPMSSTVTTVFALRVPFDALN
jgi:Domain of unknown function (DUF397)